MSRPSHPASNHCHCKLTGAHSPSSSYERVRESPRTHEGDSFYHEINAAGKKHHDNNSQSEIDAQTMNALSTFRQKACRFLNSESESSGHASSAASHQCKCSCNNQYRRTNFLRQANNMIDYVPQSEFLRRMKQQCQYLQNNQPNIFSTLENCEEFIPEHCQSCIEQTKRILSLGAQLRCNKFKPEMTEVPCRPCPCKRHSRMNNSEDNQGFFDNAENMYQVNSLDENQRIHRDFKPLNTEKFSEVTEKLLQKSEKYGQEAKSYEKKTVHISRSKKPVHRRRKRKPEILETCESQDEFAPSLKKPHENSCERCWRFASPSRSPVNKPDQRYDPNFRRGHSCADFNQERGHEDIEISGRHTSPCKNLKPIISREILQSQITRQRPEGISQVNQFSPQKTQFSQQTNQLSLQKTAVGPQTNQFSSQKFQNRPQQPQCIPQQSSLSFRQRQLSPELHQLSSEQPYKKPQQPQLGTRLRQLSPEQAYLSSGKPHSSPQQRQLSPGQTQVCPQQFQTAELKLNDSITKVKELIHNNSRSKSPEKTAPKTQPCKKCEPHKPSELLLSKVARKPRPHSFTAGEQTFKDVEKASAYKLNLTDYDIYVGRRQGFDTNYSVKRNEGVNGKKLECRPPEGDLVNTTIAGRPLSVGTPIMSNKAELNPKASSTPKQKNKSKTSQSPEQSFVGYSGKADSPSSKENKNQSPKVRSPKTQTNLDASIFRSSGSNSTIYAEIAAGKNGKPCSPKKSPAKNFKKNGTKTLLSTSKRETSPKKGSPKASPKRPHSAVDNMDNLLPISEESPRKMEQALRAFDDLFDFRDINDRYQGPHPIRECSCPPRMPFLRGNKGCGNDPDYIYCCHCHWEENYENQSRTNEILPDDQCNTVNNEKPYPQPCESNERLVENNHIPGTSRGRCSSPPKSSSPRNNVIPVVGDTRLVCPYREFQRERRGMNDTSWENDYKFLRDYIAKGQQERHVKNPEYVPTKYSVFYMTGGKKDNEDDVEVLVEELTQACPNKKDSRAKDITEKMKRIMEYPSDSMALRFQKGVSESCKTPNSSRILYF